MSFDYPHTCPKLDKVRDSLGVDIESILDTFVNTYNIEIPEDENFNDIFQALLQSIFDCTDSHIDQCREINSDLRDEAERQCEMYEQMYEDELDNVKYNEKLIVEFENEIEELKEQVEELNIEVKELNDKERSNEAN